MKYFKIFLPILLLSFISNWAATDNLKLFSQKTGPWQTNCYLLYDLKSKEAAIFDLGSSADKILEFIKTNNLKLKYIFLTHCHQDHISGVPEMIELFPDVKLCMSEKEFEDIKMYSQWRETFKSKDVETWKKSAEMVQLMDFEYGRVRKPDIFVRENTEYKLGDFSIRALMIPGHSRGSVAYFVKTFLFSGDLILYNSVGYLDYKLGSTDQIVQSVRRLYTEFNDDITICPGHGLKSTIGYEKKFNKAVTADQVKF